MGACVTDILVPMTTPAPPSSEATATRVTVRADTLQAHAEGAIHAALVTHRPVDHRQMVRLDADEPITSQSPLGVGDTHRIRFRSTPWATHVGCVLHYQASANTTAGRTILLELFDDAGVQLDVGCEFSVEDGTLDITSLGRGDGRLYDIGWVQTPDDQVDDAAAVGVSVTTPRLLTVPSANAGEVLELRITTADVRVVAADTYEAVRQVVEQ